jgi:hypothetical protein
MNGVGQRPGRLGAPTRTGMYVVGLGVWLSGGLWLVLHHWLIKRGEFGPEVNPLEPWCLKAHGAFAFATVWFFGLLWRVHVTKVWPLSWRRCSGGVMAGSLAWLTLSGYLLYYVGEDTARSIVSILHWGIGLVVPIFFFSHRFGLRKRVPKSSFRTDSFLKVDHGAPSASGRSTQSDREARESSGLAE